ncbi:DUF3237 domain-containing protein [Sphingomonas montanisoli]|uniref:DUF3237 domain-containing protein n=1 Tax=Sphingomonas montanisoli TaxID=2606412 RepID=A0A5D9C5E8_9SPHN|nr:DUF3237 domain-containing protein [Sphingomonas montanisoli]TZG26260.1 DUF3237 domain-containing protein [Sphingomonas montanisoli]
MGEMGNSFPARPLFVLTAKGMAREVLAHDGPMGRRSVARPIGGGAAGDRLTADIVPGLATEWQVESEKQPGLAWVEGLITLRTAGGTPILMKYIGRRAARYGEGAWRIGVGFEADAAGEDGAHDWLNDVVAAATVEVRGDDLIYTVHELLGRKTAPDANAIAVDPVYHMVASGTLGERIKIESQVAKRYLSIAESGCRTEGPLTAEWPVGFAWGAHRMGKGPMGFPFHIDMKAEMVAENGDMIVQQYIGTNSRTLLDPSPDIDRSWRTTAMFEAPVDGPNAWLNEVVALGFGWVQGEETHYEYYAMR